MIKKLFVSFIRLAILQIFWQAVMRLFFVNNKLVIRLILKIKLKPSALYNIAIYALTFPIILNAIYMIINIFTGFTVKYFQVMYTAISYIYVISSILIIKSDFIKKQAELTKILSEQEKVKEELAKKEQEKKEEEEKERIRKKDKGKEDSEKKEPNKKEKKDSNLGEQAEGTNA